MSADRLTGMMIFGWVSLVLYALLIAAAVLVFVLIVRILILGIRVLERTLDEPRAAPQPPSGPAA